MSTLEKGYGKQGKEIDAHDDQILLLKRAINEIHDKIRAGKIGNVKNVESLESNVENVKVVTQSVITQSTDQPESDPMNVPYTSAGMTSSDNSFEQEIDQMDADMSDICAIEKSPPKIVERNDESKLSDCVIVISDISAQSMVTEVCPDATSYLNLGDKVAVQNIPQVPSNQNTSATDSYNQEPILPTIGYSVYPGKHGDGITYNQNPNYYQQDRSNTMSMYCQGGWGYNYDAYNASLQSATVNTQNANQGTMVGGWGDYNQGQTQVNSLTA